MQEEDNSGLRKAQAPQHMPVLLPCVNWPLTLEMTTERKGKVGQPEFLFLPVLFCSSARGRQRVSVECAPRSEIRSSKQHFHRSGRNEICQYMHDNVESMNCVILVIPHPG